MNKENKSSDMKISNRNQSFSSFLDTNQHKKSKLKNKLNENPLSTLNKSAKSKQKPKKVRFSAAFDLREIPKRQKSTIRKSFSTIQSESRISLKDILYRENNLVQVKLLSSPTSNQILLKLTEQTTRDTRTRTRRFRREEFARSRFS